eukprot:Selendium_serpulae@DN4671_c1_g1_i1.p2
MPKKQSLTRSSAPRLGRTLTLRTMSTRSTLGDISPATSVHSTPKSLIKLPYTDDSISLSDDETHRATSITKIEDRGSPTGQLPVSDGVRSSEFFNTWYTSFLLKQETETGSRWIPNAGPKAKPSLFGWQCSNDEHVLRLFDMDRKFGPAAGVTRMQRWRTAFELGLSPDMAVSEVLFRITNGLAEGDAELFSIFDQRLKRIV